MALVDDDVTVLGHKVFNRSLALQTLDYSNINQAGSLALSSSNLTDASDRQI